jgi:penicillin amidase
MKLAGKILAVIVLAVLLVVTGAWLYLHQSLPKIDGDVAVKGIAAELEILRDADGIPHILAKNDADAWFAMGYVHAQDRLWQMEFQRRVVDGRLSEFLGERAYDTDRLMRTLGMARMAERIVARLDKQTMANLEAYSAGVNAFLASDPVLPVEFHVFRIKPRAWKPADTMGWLLVMAWDLSSNWRTELSRLRFANKLGRERANEIIPPYPGDAPQPLPDFKSLYADVAPTAAALLALSPPNDYANGSNSWVVSGAHTESGKPLLANDPHLGLQAPSLWYLAHLSSPAGNVVGGTLPGVPFIVLGRNDQLAWTLTTTLGDTQDLFVERVAPDDPTSYVTPAGTAKFENRDEVIRVNSEERRITIRATRHGPVISDAVKSAGEAAPKGHVLALAWAALTEDNVVARGGFALNHARTVAELHAAGREFTAPQQNVVFADGEGHIGFVAPARVPIRRADNEARGRVPVPGWDAKYDWQGFLSYEQMPAIADPASGKIVTANHKVTPAGYKPFMSVDWFPPYRADRIDELLAKTPKHSIASFASIQGDTVSRLARELLPVALAAKPKTAEGRDAQAMLKGWNMDMRVDSAAPLVFSAWYRELTRLVYADDLGDMFAESWDMRAAFMLSVLKNQGGYAKWCDDIRTPARETCDEQVSKAFDLAAAYLAKQHGEPRTWRWGAVHVAGGDHRPFSFVPVISRWFSVAPETPGDGFTVNVGHFFIRDNDRPFANRHAASLRAIYDLSDLDKSLYIHSTGQSGNFLSPWYANMADRWAKVQYVTIPAKREAIRVAHRLVLHP